MDWTNYSVQELASHKYCRLLTVDYLNSLDYSNSLIISLDYSNSLIIYEHSEAS